MPINDIFIHNCNNPDFTFCNYQTIIRVTRTKYLDIHIENLIMRLRSIIFKFYKLNKIVPLDVMCTVYESLYKYIM